MAVLIGAVAPRSPADAAIVGSRKDGRWEDPSVWGGRVPSLADIAEITHAVVLNASTMVAGVEVKSGGELSFSPTATATLESTGNVVVRGRLSMLPATFTRIHTLRFVGVDEGAFVGGGMDPLTSDVGLWVVDAGALNLVGSPKRAWATAATTVAKSATSIDVTCDPTGWRSGDEIVVTPTAKPSASGAGHATAYDGLAIASVSGTKISSTTPTAHAHPAVNLGNGVAGAEVLNLTRNVRLEGTASGRAHVFVRSTVPQMLRYVGLRHVGPRKAGGDEPVPGRYGVHFHHCMDGSRGSVVEGVVVRDAGNHAFVPHMSNGISFMDCIAHGTMEDAYWWDKGTHTHDTYFLRCVASKVSAVHSSRLTGFRLSLGDGNVVRGCVAVGMAGDKASSGFHWPEELGEPGHPATADRPKPGVWVFEDSVAHNNESHGIFVWQNSPQHHLISRYRGYHNGGAGVSQGAYLNSYRYEQGALVGNRLSGIQIHANANGHAPLYFIDLIVDGGGLSDYAVRVERHTIPKDGSPPAQPTVLHRCAFTGYNRAAVGFVNDDPGSGSAELFEVAGCSYSGNEFWLADTLVAGSAIRVEDPVHGALLLRPKADAGSYNPAWNANVGAISSFTKEPPPPVLLPRASETPLTTCEIPAGERGGGGGGDDDGGGAGGGPRFPLLGWGAAGALVLAGAGAIRLRRRTAASLAAGEPAVDDVSRDEEPPG